MHVTDTLSNFKSFLEQELQEVRLASKSGEIKAPDVHEGYLPPKKSGRDREDDSEFYPFVIVRFINDDDEINGDNVANFRLVIGTYSQDEQNGWKDTLIVIERLKLRLKEVQNVGAATLYGKIESGIFENQKKPLWHGVMDVSLKLPSVEWQRSVLDEY